jgi:CRP-like cAMP-binding protein
MLNQLIEQLKQDKQVWEQVGGMFQEKEIGAKTIILNEGEVSRNLYFIVKGCLRIWFNNDGKDISFQFFFEGQSVSSFESFFSQQPSMFSLESLEPCSLIVISRSDFDRVLRLVPELKDGFIAILTQRLSNYAGLFLSRIKDNPQKRYQELVKHYPEIIRRVPQHYIASYLGITPISLSRIRNKK